jgi:hypothetical protein
VKGGSVKPVEAGSGVTRDPRPACPELVEALEAARPYVVKARHFDAWAREVLTAIDAALAIARGVK